MTILSEQDRLLPLAHLSMTGKVAGEQVTGIGVQANRW